MDGSSDSMECERWLNARMDTLRMRTMVDQVCALCGDAVDYLLQDVDPIKMPEKIDRRVLQFNPNEINVRGESLFYSVIRYITDVHVQVR